MVELTEKQRVIIRTDGHQLVTGGPGSGKTTVSILKAAQLAGEKLHPGGRVLFLSFARATVSRVMEAIAEERSVSAVERSRIEVDTYHSFFWRLLKTHGYLIGLPRRLSLLAPPAEAIALAALRSQFKRDSKLTEAERADKALLEHAERQRLAHQEGRVCFELFASSVRTLLEGSDRIRTLIADMYPCIVLDEFQDTNQSQWLVVRQLGRNSTLVALADPEQRIFDFIGADPARLGHFREAFCPVETDLSTENHRSKGTEIAIFGNEVLHGRFSKSKYVGVEFVSFPANPNQAYTSLVTQTLQARTRLLKVGQPGWSLAILVPTKKMTRAVSDTFRAPIGSLPQIYHTAAVDMEGPILAAEIVAYLMQPDGVEDHFHGFVELICSFYQGKDGDNPSSTALREADSIRAARDRGAERTKAGKATEKKSVMVAMRAVYDTARALTLTGDPDLDWRAIRATLEKGTCTRLQIIGREVRNVRLLERGTQLRQALSEDWRTNGGYRNALSIAQEAFIIEHFASASKPESGVVVMNMHKAKGKQFDEVIIFEGWPVTVRGEVKSNPDRIVRGNKDNGNIGQARQNMRVSITRAKRRTTIMSPATDVCILFSRD